MKQKFLSSITPGLLLLAILISGNAEAQTVTISPSSKTAKTYLDLMVNVASSNIYYGDMNSQLSDYRKQSHGIQAGLSFQAGVTRMFSLVSELYYMRKGGSLKDNNSLTTDQSTLRIHTIEMPVMARLHLGKFYVNAGPSIAYNISGTWKINDHSTKLSFDESTNGFKRFDAGVQMGGGFEWPFAKRRISLDIRYNHGLTNISQHKEIYNRAIMVSVHFSKPWKTNPLARNK